MKIETHNYQVTFTTLFKDYRLELYNTAFKITKSKATAEDIVHDVFLKLWLKRAELDNIEKFRSYLFVMARNRVLDKIKKYKRESHLTENLNYRTVTGEDIEDRITSREYAYLLKKTVARMPLKQQHAFRLVKETGLSYKETASILHISDLTVKKHITNALKFISYHFKISGMPLSKRKS